jgi:hypothetical protein
MAYQKQVGALWLKKKQNEDGSELTYMRGYIDNGLHGNIPIVIFRVRNKQNENSPDYRMILSQPLPQPAQEQGEEEPPIEDDDVPF